MFKWMEDEGFEADVTELRRMHPGLIDFGTYVKKTSGLV